MTAWKRCDRKNCHLAGVRRVTTYRRPGFSRENWSGQGHIHNNTNEGRAGVQAHGVQNHPVGRNPVVKEFDIYRCLMPSDTDKVVLVPSTV